MTHNTEPLKQALREATEGNQADIYTLLANWNTTLDSTLDQSGDLFRDVLWDYLKETLEVIDVAAVGHEPDWSFLQDCADAYPPAVGDHHCTMLIANILGRCIIRTRLRHDVDEIPTWALNYLGEITREDDKDIATEESAAFGWGIGHQDKAVADRILARAEADDEFWAASALIHVTFADANAAINLYDRILQSQDTTEDLHYVEGMQRILDHSFPESPRYWDPTTELDSPDPLSDDDIEHLLRVLGENVHPKRLQQFDHMIQFDLKRAATKYGDKS